MDVQTYACVALFIFAMIAVCMVGLKQAIKTLLTSSALFGGMFLILYYLNDWIEDQIACLPF